MVRKWIMLQYNKIQQTRKWIMLKHNKHGPHLSASLFSSLIRGREL